jgi:hypothetical protein
MRPEPDETDEDSKRCTHVFILCSGSLLGVLMYRAEADEVIAQGHVHTSTEGPCCRRARHVASPGPFSAEFFFTVNVRGQIRTDVKQTQTR